MRLSTGVRCRSSSDLCDPAEQIRTFVPTSGGLILVSRPQPSHRIEAGRSRAVVVGRPARSERRSYSPNRTMISGARWRVFTSVACRPTAANLAFTSSVGTGTKWIVASKTLTLRGRGTP